MTTLAEENLEGSAYCDDCGRQYGAQYGFPDLIIPYNIWCEISPTADEGGLLCPSCICQRLYAAGKKQVPGAFMSGPIKSVDMDLMWSIRMVENILRREDAAGNSHSEE